MAALPQKKIFSIQKMATVKCSLFAADFLMGSQKVAVVISDRPINKEHMIQMPAVQEEFKSQSQVLEKFFEILGKKIGITPPKRYMDERKFNTENENTKNTLCTLLLKSCTENSLDLYNSCLDLFKDPSTENDCQNFLKELPYYQKYADILNDVSSKYHAEQRSLRLQKLQLDTAYLEIRDLEQKIKSDDEMRLKFLQRMDRSDKSFQQVNTDLAYHIDKLNIKIAYANYYNT